MQRVLSQNSLRQMAGIRVCSWMSGLAATELPPATCWCVAPPRPAFLLGERQFSTSSPSRAVERPKQAPPPPNEDDPTASPSQPTPHTTLAGSDEASGRPPAATSTPAEVVEEPDPLQDKSIGLIQRFKKVFKQYGKVMIPVHLLTSSVWFGTFYYAAMKGVNVVPFLEAVGLPEFIVGLLRDSSSGYALTAYAMYKIATPARYTVTLGGTELMVQYLRKHGYIPTPPPVAMKDYLQDRMEETRDKLSERMEETRDKLSEKMEETKHNISEKMEETKERLSDKMEETKERLSDKMEETKERLSDKMEETKGRITGRMEETKGRFCGKVEETKDKFPERLHKKTE